MSDEPVVYGTAMTENRMVKGVQVWDPRVGRHVDSGNPILTWADVMLRFWPGMTFERMDWDIIARVADEFGPVKPPPPASSS